MTSLTAWQRCEPHSRSADPGISLEMRSADPLWMLGRQWQFGEFKGEDAGSPAWVSWLGATMPLALYLPGPVDGHEAGEVQPYDKNTPLESVVERESQPARDAMLWNRRLAVEAGWHFMRLLPEATATAYRAKLLDAAKLQRVTGTDRDAFDAASLAFLDLASGRGLDGVRLLDIAATPASAPATLGFAAGDVAIATTAIQSWLDWVAATIGPVDAPAPTRQSWNSSRLEYAFALAAPADAAGAQHVLEATQHDGDSLDWYSVDHRAGKLLTATAAPPDNLAGATLPTGLHFRGMPVRRLWEFEDAQVSFGATSAAATDLTRMLFLEFLLQYGNDFFVVPIELSYGSLCRIDQVTVTNTFGEATTAAPFANDDWRMFTLSDSLAAAGSATPPMLFLPPVVAQELVSAPLETVQFMRDEMANLCWAIERLVESRTGRPLNRQEVWQAGRPMAPPATADGQATLSWQLDTWADSSPDHWFPLTPTADPSGMLALIDAARAPRGRIVADIAQSSARLVYDEEIPRAGTLVERRWQYCRWHGGAIHAWITRRKRIGRGEGSSGLAYDVVR